MIDDDRRSNDAELRELFTILRQQEQLRTPPFMVGSSVRRSAARWPFGLKLVQACVCVAAVLAAALYLRHEPLRRVPAQQTGAQTGAQTGTQTASITQWKPATDFLLNTPASEMLRATPNLDLRPYLGATPHLTQRTIRVRKRPLH